MLAAATDTNAVNTMLAIFTIVPGIIGYFIPTIVALARHVPNAGSVVVIDLLLGWTVIGWIVA